jgi:hypothetical protein
MFSFFWWGGFFTRNIADVRPLFDKLPLLLILLVSALTMRVWSEEQKRRHARDLHDAAGGDPARARQVHRRACCW